MQILLVDDDAIFLALLNEFLITSGYDVIQVADGNAAINAFSDYSPDLIITDIVMPGIDGIELLTSLRKNNPNVKVIVMSGGNNGHAGAYLGIAENLGADAALNKPFKLPKLLDEIKKIESTL